MIEKLKKTRAFIQLAGVIISSVIAAVTALQLGGDPLEGAAVGFVINSTLAAVH